MFKEVDLNRSWVVFFFSSRRRHTRYWRDWSSTCALPISPVDETTLRDAGRLLPASLPGGQTAHLRRFLPMDPVSETPTEPVDYAAISAAYGALLGTIVLAARDRGDEPVKVAEFVPLGIAAFALTKALSREKVESWVRQPFLDEEERRPKGRRLRYAVGELLSCTRCLGAWSALGLTALRVTRPREARVVTTVLATNAVNDFMFAGFSAVTAAANARDRWLSDDD